MLRFVKLTKELISVTYLHPYLENLNVLGVYLKHYAKGVSLYVKRKKCHPSYWNSLFSGSADPLNLKYNYKALISRISLRSSIYCQCIKIFYVLFDHFLVLLCFVISSVYKSLIIKLSSDKSK